MLRSLLVCVALTLASSPAVAEVYSGNGNSGFGGAVGQGNLEITSDGTTLTFTLTRGPGDLTDTLVLYFDSIAGGFADTTSLTDQADDGRRAVSGIAGTDSADVAFPAGFSADYGLSFDAANGGFLFQLIAGGSHLFLNSAGGGGFPASSFTFTFTIPIASLGLSAGEPFSFVATYLNPTNAFRSDEAIGTGIAAGNPGAPSAVAFAGAFAFGTSPSLNEIRPDQPSTDDDEFLEIAGPPGLALDNLYYLAIGDGAGGSGVIEDAIVLTGYVIPASGYFVVAEASFSLGTPDLIRGNLAMENSDNVTYLLVTNFTAATGTDLDTNDDGTLDATPWDEIIDIVAFIEEPNPPTGTEYHYSPTVLGPDGTAAPMYGLRCPDANGGWIIGPQAPGVVDTPGATNEPMCPEVAVRGNGVEIANGDTTPSFNDGTDFGTRDAAWTHSFVIENTGAARIDLTGAPLVEIRGSAAIDFAVTSDPATPILGGTGTTFDITFTPTAMGSRQATVSIRTTDVDEDPYDFAIQGDGIVYVTISGNAGVGDAVLSYDDGGPQTVLADASGDFSITVASGWTGDVTPSLRGYLFTPTSMSYTNVIADQLNQDYVAVTSCADGIVAGAETCDDGSPGDGDGCSSTCAVESGWDCVTTPGNAPESICSTVCNDGILVASFEACDDGNNNDADGCAADCSAVESGWDCPTAGAACIEVCGDGAVVGAEGCDDTNTNAGDGCAADCSTVENGWQCLTVGAACTLVCGDGLVVGTEACDDANATDGDGCTACAVDLGWSCDTSEPSLCTRDAFCGDGDVGLGEDCDDSNDLDGDGCSALCAVETGWSCNGASPTVCFSDTDGDGVEDSVDNCLVDHNPGQQDTDADGTGDVCDSTPNGETIGGGSDGGGCDCGAGDPGFGVLFLPALAWFRRRRRRATRDGGG